MATTTVTPSGGTLSIPEAGLVLFFPRGAVASDLEVTVTAHRGKNVVYTFEPHGVQFAHPIVIAQALRSVKHARNRDGAPEEMHGGYLPQGIRDVDAQGYASFAETFAVSYSLRGEAGNAWFLTTHFSGYALASGRGGVKVQDAELGQ